MTSVLEWCHDRMDADSGPTGSEQGTVESACSAGNCQAPADGLLLRCMDRLQIDRNALAEDAPALFREIQDSCASCRGKKDCARALAHGLDAPPWEHWREYCPNSAMLEAIGAVQNCARAAQYLKMPHPTEPRSTAALPRAERS